MIITDPEGNKDVLFGDGSILVSAGKGLLEERWYDALLLSSKDPEPVGVSRPDCSNKELLGCEVRLLFTCVESIDVVIEGLLHVRDSLEAQPCGKL